jgi:hypothetical protein
MSFKSRELLIYRANGLFLLLFLIDWDGIAGFKGRLIE